MTGLLSLLLVLLSGFVVLLVLFIGRGDDEGSVPGERRLFGELDESVILFIA